MLWEISVFIFTLAFLLFAFFWILYLLQLRKTAKHIEIVLVTLNQSLPGILAKLDAAAGYLADSTGIIKSCAESLALSMAKIQHIVDDIVDFEQTLRREIETPLLQASGTCQAFMKGVRVFLTTLLSRP